jgi:hypothetical protein
MVRTASARFREGKSIYADAVFTSTDCRRSPLAGRRRQTGGCDHPARTLRGRLSLASVEARPERHPHHGWCTILVYAAQE